MPTLNKLEYLNETKQEIKSALNNNFNSGITDEDTFRSYVSKINNIYTNWTKVTGEGTEITLTPTRKGRMQLGLKGNISQDSLPAGYTALDYIESTGTQYIDTGVKVSTNNKIIADLLFTDVSRSQMNGGYYIYKIDNKSYTVRNDIGVASTGFFFIGASVESITTNVTADTNRHTFMVNATTGEWAIDDVSGSVSPASHEDGISNVLVGARQGTNTIGGAMPPQSYCYEKIYNVKIYNSGNLVRNLIPCKNLSDVVGMYDLVTNTFFTNSGTGDFIAGNEVTIPSPDYPQDIRVVTGDNTIKVENNAFDITTITENTYIDNTGRTETSSVTNLSDYVLIEPFATYILTYKYETLLNTNQRNVCYYDKNKNFISGILYSPTDKVHSITTPNNAKYLRFSYDKNISNIRFIIESQSYSLNLGSIELCKIGAYQDYIYKDNGKWYLHKEIGKVVLDGTQAMYSRETKETNKKRFKVVLTKNLPNQSVKCICDTLVLGTLIDGNNCKNSITTIIANTNYYGNISFYREDYSSYTAEQAQTALSQNNMIVYYVLATPTDEEITDTTLIGQLNAINDALSFDGQTNISSEYATGNAPVIISASALMKGGN